MFKEALFSPKRTKRGGEYWQMRLERSRNQITFQAMRRNVGFILNVMQILWKVVNLWT